MRHHRLLSDLPLIVLFLVAGPACGTTSTGIVGDDDPTADGDTVSEEEEAPADGDDPDDGDAEPAESDGDRDDADPIDPDPADDQTDAADGDTADGDAGEEGGDDDTGGDGDVDGDEESHDSEPEGTEVEVDPLEEPWTTTADGLFLSTGNPYEAGPLAVRLFTRTGGQDGAPVDLQIHVPDRPGRYAVVLFQHGFQLNATHYVQLARAIASHGFVVVVPTMYTFLWPSVAEEATRSRNILLWIPRSLAAVAGVEIDGARIGYAGHSRGGKVVWTNLRTDAALVRGAIGVDPVDGTGGPLGGEARVLDYAFDYTIPSLILGTGLGPTGAQACAPTGDNHIQFYAASPSPAWHAIATDYGHNDMLDDSATCLACGACPAGPSRASMRGFVAGQIVAFLRGAVLDDREGYAWLSVAERVPVRVDLERK